METAVFLVAAAIVLAGAFGVILYRNPVHSALSLVATLFGVAVLFVNQDAQLLAAVQVIVYAGAIVVLFLFVIMLLGVDRADSLREEPLPAASALWDNPKIRISAHTSPSSSGTVARSDQLFLDNLKLYARGERLLTEVDEAFF